MKSVHICLLLAVCLSAVTGFDAFQVAAQEKELRVGHFPNLTHAAALVEHARWRRDPSAVERGLGEGVKIKWFTYNAGPSAMEALLIGDLDIAYVGPNPAINAYVRSKGEEVRVIAGATLGGAALLVQGDSSIARDSDFRNKRIGTPQLGNTQDIAARAWLKKNGLQISLSGGDAQVVPADNPDLLTLFLGKQLDAVWTVEPWVSRLEKEGRAVVYLSDSQAITTILVCSVRALREKSEIVRRFLELHRVTTTELVSNPGISKDLVSEELKAETNRTISPEILESAWSRMGFSADLPGDELQQFLRSAQDVGFLKDVSDLKRFLHDFK